MERRTFLAASLAAGASSFAVAQAPGPAGEPAPAPGAVPAGPRLFYLLRRYTLTMGAQPKAAQSYFAEALIPALNRLGIKPVGAFELTYGPDTPSYYLLVPSPDAALLATLDGRLAADGEFQRAAAAFWAAPASSPAFTRIESSLLGAFASWPQLREAAQGPARILQLRTYASATHAAHVRKVEMFDSGECTLFERMDCHPVLFSADLIGPNLPSLTYMLSFASMSEMEAGWARFVASPEWKAMSTSPRYSSEELVSNITNLILRPLACSQI